MRQLTTRHHMTQKLTNMSHHTAYNNEQTTDRIVTYKKMTIVKQGSTHFGFDITRYKGGMKFVI